MTGTTKASLMTASQLLGVDPAEMEDSLVSRVMMPKGGSKGTVIKYVESSIRLV